MKIKVKTKNIKLKKKLLHLRYFLESDKDLDKARTLDLIIPKNGKIVSFRIFL